VVNKQIYPWFTGNVATKEQRLNYAACASSMDCATISNLGKEVVMYTEDKAARL